MRRLSIRAFREVGEPLEIYWLAGLQKAESGEWLVRVVTLGLETQKVVMWKLPIGILSLLSLGLRFDDRGGLLETQSRGQLMTATLPNVAGGEEITSAEMPEYLYPFFGHNPGVQRLIRYSTHAGEILVPTIELVRYLLLHNKTLANALMVPGQLLTLYHFQPIGIYDELTLGFTADMPVRALSRGFALEFSRLAIHPEGRKAWDSVYRRTAGNDYVGFDPPNVQDANMTFRGIKRNGVWLVLEIQYLSGREPPCERLRYGHPGFRVATGSSVFGKGVGGGEPSKTNTGNDVDVVVSDEGTQIATSQSAVDFGSKSSEFTSFVPTEKIWLKSEHSQRRTEKGPRLEQAGDENSEGGSGVISGTTKRGRRIKGSVGRESRGSHIPPLEFRTLEAHPWDFVGELQALADTITIMAGLFAETEISMSLCSLKQGRAFSTVGRRPRCCLVVHINVANSPPIVLMDVDRAGERALSTMSLAFLEPAPFSEIETHVKAVLDRLVDHGRHWDPLVEKELQEVCICTRLPKVLPQRDNQPDRRYRKVWAWRLALRLGLPLITSRAKA